jgi:hypothetical protein
MRCLRAAKGFNQRAVRAAMTAMNGEQRGVIEHGVSCLVSRHACLPFAKPRKVSIDADRGRSALRRARAAARF